MVENLVVESAFWPEVEPTVMRLDWDGPPLPGEWQGVLSTALGEARDLLLVGAWGSPITGIDVTVLMDELVTLDEVACELRVERDDHRRRWLLDGSMSSDTHVELTVTRKGAASLLLDTHYQLSLEPHADPDWTVATVLSRLECELAFSIDEATSTHRWTSAAASFNVPALR